MEKHIARWSYWLGVVCAAIALGWKGLNALGWGPHAVMTLAYTSFYKAAILFLLTSVATAGYAWVKGQKT